jgi:F-type H+-transporting ATPase subunit a
MPHISLAAEIVTRFGGFPVSNALITTWLVMGILLMASYLATRRMTLVPQNGQAIAEVLVGGLYDFFTSVTGKYVSQVFGLVASLFLFILVANWVGLLPGVGTVGFFLDGHEKKMTSVQTVDQFNTRTENQSLPDAHEKPTGTKTQSVLQVEEENSKKIEIFVPLFRGATADLNTTLALALFAMISIQYYGFKTAGMHYGKRFFNVANPIFFFLGVLELISELSKVVSFAFRLFGNIFAGEVLLAVMAFLMPFIVPLPFLMMELFVGFIQALVFSMLTAVFLSVAVSHGEHEKHMAEGGVSTHG